MKLTLEGRPITKKNHSRIVRAGNRHVVFLHNSIGITKSVVLHKFMMSVGSALIPR